MTELEIRNLPNADGVKPLQSAEHGGGYGWQFWVLKSTAPGLLTYYRSRTRGTIFHDDARRFPSVQSAIIFLHESEMDEDWVHVRVLYAPEPEPVTDHYGFLA